MVGVKSMRGREIFAQLDKRGIDPKLLRVLVRIGEDHAAIEQNQIHIMATLDQMIDIISKLTIVGDNMKSTIEKLRSNDEKAKEAGVFVQSEDPSTEVN